MKTSLIHDAIDHITPEAVERSATSLVPAGTVLVVTRSGILRHSLPVAVTSRQVALNQDIKALIPNVGASAEYVAWVLRAFDRAILESCSKTGTTVQNIETPKLLDFEVPLPPLAEQRRIVAAIEEHFSRLDAAEESLRRAQRRVDRLRDSILDEATEGSGHPRIELGDVALLITDGDHNPPKRVANGIPHLTAKHVKNGRLTLDGCTFVSEEGFEQTRQRYEPRENDVIVTCVGTIGEIAVVPPDFEFSADRNLAAVRVGSDSEPQYLRFALSARRQKRAMIGASGSTAQPHLYLRDIRSLPVPWPPLADQRRIVAEVERQLSLVDALAAATTAALKRSAALRRSILERAFSGKLVPQDSSDEPASVLLARIRAERAAEAGCAPHSRCKAV